MSQKTREVPQLADTTYTLKDPQRIMVIYLHVYTVYAHTLAIESTHEYFDIH